MALNMNRRGKGRRKVRHKRVDAADLLRTIPPELLEHVGALTQVDKNVSRLRGELILQLLIIGMLDGNDLSTRLLAEHYNSPVFKAISGKGDHQTAHSSIASRLSTIPADYFQQIFEYLFHKYQKLLTRSALGKRIKRFDSTMVPISSALVDFGMAVGPKPKKGHRTHQLKFTLELHGRLPKSIKLFTEQSHLSEQTALRQAITEADIDPGDLVVFDAGLSDRKTFVSFDQASIHFVSRLKSNYRAQKRATHRDIKGRQADGLEFIRDDRVYLYASAEQVVEHEFRLIEVRVLDTDKTLVFVTNIWDLSAMQIARIYRQRWDIEVFFRFLKQNLNFTKLINRSTNGIQVQMYAALITAILLLVYQDRNKIEGHNIAKLRFTQELIVAFATKIGSNPSSAKPPDQLIRSDSG